MLLNTKINQNKKQGVTLVEVLIVLAIAAVIIAGALVLYGNLQRNSAVNEETTNLSAMFQNIDNFFRRGSTGALTNVEALTAGFIPGGMLVTDETAVDGIENSFGGRVIINGQAATPTTSLTNAKAFEVAYTRVPQEACVNLVQGQARVGWDAVGVNDADAVGGTPGAAEAKYSNDTGGVSLVSGSTPLSEISIIQMCDTTEEFVAVTFVKDSEL
tara:strand:- start:803 stop:1447 length:645 start_codon:yes stop_codon:yes gene_type:complete